MRACLVTEKGNGIRTTEMMPVREGGRGPLQILEQVQPLSYVALGKLLNFSGPSFFYQSH